MLDADTKAKWIAALRSGDYKQCRDQLYNGLGYCCLGVLCKLNGDDIEAGKPPYPAVAEMIPNWKVLADLNDRDKKDFIYIADYIEKNIPAGESNAV